ncbi:SMP-30/gluconolactonase/LRE family protein [Aquimarina spongiae]|uniref:ATP/GTP-binding protein n=1 Tax=Aquimarina spongiae TaxID=570521 RepID=A0A1M6G5D3_9FLAO|nr:hypothetical protein [Aquimarina spongiae]SHJ05159.1 hypothetical protein SAMN04488508_10585 [Aquimarina spongiae]
MKQNMIWMSIVVLIFTNVSAQKVKKIWEVNGLEAPESVVFDKENQVYYVSNVAGQPAEKNGLGYISIVTTDGNIKTKKWIEGLNAPKGLGLYNNHLYIADIDVVVIVDISKGEILDRLPAEKATFLNDIEIDTKGTVYVTDTFGGNAIYSIKDKKIELWLKDEKLDYPNGLKIVNNQLYVASWGVVTNPKTFETEVPGKLMSVDLSTKQIKDITVPKGNYDGLVKHDSQFLISDWIAGGVYAIDQKGEIIKVLDSNPGAADIFLNKEEKLLLVPQMLDGKMTVYQLSE